MHAVRLCLAKIQHVWKKSNNSQVFDVDSELWTVKKVLRRFIWHDRIHGRAITRIWRSRNGWVLSTPMRMSFASWPSATVFRRHGLERQGSRTCADQRSGRFPSLPQPILKRRALIPYGSLEQRT
jgi:hypothetical protein